jgi:hypothetical protein
MGKMEGRKKDDENKETNVHNIAPQTILQDVIYGTEEAKL